MAQKTAVEWLIEKMLDNGIGICKEWREQAKQMEKEQIIQSRITAPLISTLDEAEQYYNEVYGGQGSLIPQLPPTK